MRTEAQITEYMHSRPHTHGAMPERRAQRIADTIKSCVEARTSLDACDALIEIANVAIQSDDPSILAIAVIGVRRIARLETENAQLRQRVDDLAAEASR